MAYVYFSNLFVVTVVLFWQMDMEATLVGVGEGREMVLRNTFLSEKQEPKNETEAFSFPSCLLGTLPLKTDI